MVLWEITLGTAYFLGLKRTYRLALKIQRRLISPKHPKIRQFAHRRIRHVFDVAVKVHKNVQERDIEVGRNVGNWILRWLDRMKPSAQIRVSTTGKPPVSGNANRNIKQLNNSDPPRNPGGFQRCSERPRGNRESDRLQFSSLRNSWPIMMMRPAKPAGTNIQHRHFHVLGPEASKLSYGGVRGGYGGVVRDDIMQWMHRNQ